MKNFRVSSRAFVIALLALLPVSACTRKTANTQGTSQNKVVNLAIWSNYLKPEVLAEFERREGVKIQVSNYSSNEELLAKLQAGASGYDVVVPSDYMVFAMTKLGLLRELDFKQIPNFKSLSQKYLKLKFDPANKYSVPYDVGTTGIAVNRKLYQGKITGWRDLFGNPDLAGKVTLLDDARETIGAALKAQGFSLNSKDPAQLEKAKELLLKMRPRVKAFTSEPMMPLVNGETAVAHAYSSDALQARRQTGGTIEYIIPEEGATFWLDCLVVPTGAQNVKEAHALINFLLEPKIGAQTTLSVLVAPANKDAMLLLPLDLQDNPVLFPRARTLSRLEMLEDLGEGLKTWDRIWTEVKTGAE